MLNQMVEKRNDKRRSASKKVDEKPKSKSPVIIIALLLVLIVIGIIVIIVLLTDKDDNNTGLIARENVGVSVPSRGMIVTPENVDEVRASMESIAPIEDRYFETAMNFDWTFDTWDTPSKNAYVKNSENNGRIVYFDVTIDNTGELVYSSPYISIGAVLENFALNRELSAGNYTATLTYYLVDDEFNEVSNLSVVLTLRITN